MAHPLVEFENNLRARIDWMQNDARMREAPPDVFRAELNVFLQTILPHVEGSARYYGDEAWGARMRQTLAELPETATRAYAARIGVVLPDSPVANPASPAPAPKKASSVFANAKATSKDQPWKAAAATYDPSYTYKCIHCGAPQQVELNFMCRFCHKKINE